jgi:hypothetical protein
MEEKLKPNNKVISEMSIINNDSNYLLISRPETLIRDNSPNIGARLSRKTLSKGNEESKTYPKGANMSKVYEEDDGNIKTIKDDKRTISRKDKIVKLINLD